MLRDTREKKIFTIALGVKLVLFLVVYLIFGTHGFFSTDDSWGYMRLAGNMVHERTFSDATEAPFVPDALNTPGYPLYLAVTAIPFDTAFVSIIIQIVMLSFATVLLYRTLCYFFPYKTAFVTSLLFALEPWNVYSATSVLSETIFLVCFIAGLYAFVRLLHEHTIHQAYIAGLLLSAATLVRPVTLYMLPIFFLVYIGHLLFIPFQKKYILYAGVFLCASYALVLGWSFRNMYHFDSFSLTTKGAYTLYFYDAAQFLVYRDVISPDVAQDRLIERARQTFPEVRIKDDLKHVRYGPYLTSETFKIIGENPFLYTKMHTISFATFLLSDGYRLLLRELRLSDKTLPNISMALFRGDIKSIFNYFVTDPVSAFLFWVGFVFWALINLSALCAVFFAWWRKEEKKIIWFFVFSMVCVAYFGLILGPVAQARYRVPVTLFLFPMAIYTLSVLRILWLSRNRV